MLKRPLKSRDRWPDKYYASLMEDYPQRIQYLRDLSITGDSLWRSQDTTFVVHSICSVLQAQPSLLCLTLDLPPREWGWTYGPNYPRHFPPIRDALLEATVAFSTLKELHINNSGSYSEVTEHILGLLRTPLLNVMFYGPDHWRYPRLPQALSRIPVAIDHLDISQCFEFDITGFQIPSVRSLRLTNIAVGISPKSLRSCFPNLQRLELDVKISTIPIHQMNPSVVEWPQLSYVSADVSTLRQLQPACHIHHLRICHYGAVVDNHFRNMLRSTSPAVLDLDVFEDVTTPAGNFLVKSFFAQMPTFWTLYAAALSGLDLKIKLGIDTGRCIERKRERLEDIIVSKLLRSLVPLNGSNMSAIHR